MTDFSFSDDLELQKLNAQVLAEPEEFEHWEKLVRAAEAQEGGLNRNSSPQAIAATRDTYDRFLDRFPLFFGYWKKYADLEFSISGTETAEMVYERGVASIGISVDLWANYCAFKVETNHDADVTRELFERAAQSVGLDFLAHPFWDKYLEFEERLEAQGRVFALLGRLIHIPLHQYARYFERYRALAQQRPLSELASAEIIMQLRQEVELENAVKPKSDAEVERELRTRLDALHLETFQRTQGETSKRWTYESEIKRPYFHVTELDDVQLGNWKRYLDFEEGEGDYARTKFLYERCLVTAAYYDEFWLRYARWMLGQTQKPKVVRDEELRIIYQRASLIFVPIAQPGIRLQYARFEESLGRADVAMATHEAILLNLPDHLETMLSSVNLHRRQSGIDAALQVLAEYAANPEISPITRGSLVAEHARLLWQTRGDAPAARAVFEAQKHVCLDSRQFWSKWLDFEMIQPALGDTAAKQVQTVYQAIRRESRLSPGTVKDLTASYLEYIVECGGKKAMEEFMALDRDINGPVSVANRIDPPQLDNGNDADNHLNSSSRLSGPAANGQVGASLPDSAYSTAAARSSFPKAPSQIPLDQPLNGVPAANPSAHYS